MRRNIKNDKVIKAITIGLATMIAVTSSPIAVLANDENEGNNGDSQENQQQSPVDAAVEQRTEVQNQVDPAVQQAGVASAEVTEAKEAIDAVAAGLGSDVDQELLSAVVAIQEDLKYEGSLKEGTTELDSDNTGAGAFIDEAKTDLQIYQGIALGNANLAIAQEEMNIVNQQADPTNPDGAWYDAQTVIDDANIANTTSSQSEAIAAKDRAESELNDAEAELKVAVDAYTDAEKAVKAAQTNYNNAYNAWKKAKEKSNDLKNAVNALDRAGANTAAALEKLNDAEKKVKKLEDEVNASEANVEEIKAIHDQYYAFMVQYYRTVFDKDRATLNSLYNADGTLNIEKAAEKITQEQIDAMAVNPGNTTMELGRDLLKKLVDYMYENDENVAVDENGQKIYKFGTEGKTNKTAREGTVFESGNSNDLLKDADNKVVIDENGHKVGQDVVAVKAGRKDINQMEVVVTTPNGYQIKTTNSTQGDGGRTNRFAVTYTDVNGESKTAYYNYIYKASQDITGENGLNMEKGPVYLAEVVKEGDSWVTKRVISANNYDDYTKFSAYTKLFNYMDAVRELEEAKEEVKKLKEMMPALSDMQIPGQEAGLDLDGLKKILEKAKKALTEAETNKKNLEEKVAEARRAFESIDLSRFNVSDDDDDDDTTGDTTYDPGTGTLTIPGFEVPSFVIPAAAAGTMGTATGTTTGVLGVRTETPADQIISSLDTKIVNKPVAKKTIANKTNKKGTKVSDPIVPLADMPFEDSSRMNWWWLLIIFLLGATGKKMYDEHKKKVEAREAAKNIDK